MRARLFVLLAFAASTGCERQLSIVEAERVVSTYPQAGTLGRIEIQGISHVTGSNDAIVRVALGATSLNAKLRRHNSGWVWELVETPSGFWVKPDQGIRELRKAERQKRIQAWARVNFASYSATIGALADYSGDLDRRTEVPLSLESWMEHRRRMAGLLRNFRRFQKIPKTEIEAEVAEMLRPKSDAWKQELLVSFDSAMRLAIFRSVGPDQRTGTSDDVVCLAQGVREWDNLSGKVMWNYVTSWILPEGLEGAIKPILRRQGRGSAEYTRHVD